eukprot:763940-Hanusia_phi.AAC.7
MAEGSQQGDNIIEGMSQMLSVNGAKCDLTTSLKTRKRCGLELEHHSGMVQENFSKATRGHNVVDIKDVRNALDSLSLCSPPKKQCIGIGLSRTGLHLANGCAQNDTSYSLPHKTRTPKVEGNVSEIMSNNRLCSKTRAVQQGVTMPFAQITLQNNLLEPAQAFLPQSTNNSKQAFIVEKWQVNLFATVYAVVLYQPPDQIVKDILTKAFRTDFSSFHSVETSTPHQAGTASTVGMECEQDDREFKRSQRELERELEACGNCGKGAKVLQDTKDVASKDVAFWSVWPSQEQQQENLSDETESLVDFEQDCSKNVFKVSDDLMLLDDIGIRNCNVGSPRPMNCVAV